MTLKKVCFTTCYLFVGSLNLIFAQDAAAVVAVPSGLVYSSVTSIYTKNAAISPNEPSSRGGVVASYSIAPVLPTGLKLNLTTGVITGTPLAVSAVANYKITAKNAAGIVAFSIKITVQDAAPTALAYTKPDVIYTKNYRISANLPTVISGTPTLYTIAPVLPAGLVLNAVTGAITGIPTVAAARVKYTVQASNSAGKISKAIYIQVDNTRVTSCQITISVCAKNSGYAKTFADTRATSATDARACLNRAVDWYNYCGVDATGKNLTLARADYLSAHKIAYTNVFPKKCITKGDIYSINEALRKDPNAIMCPNVVVQRVPANATLVKCPLVPWFASSKAQTCTGI